MPRALRSTAILVASASISLGTIACRGGEKAARRDAGAKQSASVPKTQTIREPCGWISRADAERILADALIGDPVRVKSADNTQPTADGDGCLYEMKSTTPGLRRLVSIEVTVDDPGTIQAGFSGVPDLQAAFKDSESHGDSLVAGRWDYVSGVPGGLTAARTGRITVQIFAFGEQEKGMALAGAIVDRIPDRPFTEDPADPGAAPSVE